MKKIIAFCFIILTMTLIGNFSFVNADEPKTDATWQEIDKDGVAFSLIHHRSHWNLRGINNQEKMWIIPQLVVWNDGRVLLGKDWDRERDDWEYYFGKVDPKTIREMQDHIRSSFRIAKANQEIVDFGPDASYNNLQVYSDDGELSIMTWEEFKNAGVWPETVRLKAEDAIDGKPMFLPEFYDVWKKVKADVLQLGETATQNTEPVQVVGERSAFTVKDRADNVLAEYPPKITTLVVKIESITMVQSNLMPPKNWRVEASVVRRSGGLSAVQPGEKVSFLIHSPTLTFRTANAGAEVIGQEFKIRYESDFTRENYYRELRVDAVD